MHWVVSDAAVGVRGGRGGGGGGGGGQDELPYH